MDLWLLHLHLSDKYRQLGLRELEQLEQLGVVGHLLGRAGLEELEPGLKPEVQSGIFYPEPAQIKPDKFVKAVAKQAEREGATILTQTAVARCTI